jgi:hypothetical protein
MRRVRSARLCGCVAAARLRNTDVGRRRRSGRRCRLGIRHFAIQGYRPIPPTRARPPPRAIRRRFERLGEAAEVFGRSLPESDRGRTQVADAPPRCRGETRTTPRTRVNRRGRKSGSSSEGARRGSPPTTCRRRSARATRARPIRPQAPVRRGTTRRATRPRAGSPCATESLPEVSSCLSRLRNDASYASWARPTT